MKEFVMDGYVQSQIEDRAVRNGRAVTKFSLNSPDYDPQSGTRTPNFFDVEYWHDAQDDRRRSIQEGALLMVWGRFRQDRWQDKQTGQNRSRVVFDAREVAVVRAPQPRQCRQQGYQQDAYATQQPAYPPQQAPQAPPAPELYDEDIDRYLAGDVGTFPRS